MSNAATGEEFTAEVQKYRHLKWIYRWRGYFYVPVLLVMPFCFWNEYENEAIIWAVGLPLMALALVIRVWATRHVGKKIPRKYKGGKSRLLIVTGPYRLARNPLYIGNIAAMMGLCFISELLWFMPIVFAYFFLLYSFIVRYEEYKLSVLFGTEYEMYRQKVPRWIPRFSMVRRGKCGGFSWKGTIRAELPNVVATSLMMLILLGKEITGA